MAKVAFFASLFCAGAATSTFLGWLVALSPVFFALASWLSAVIILIMGALIVFDDGIRDLLGFSADNAYYGGIAGLFLSLLIGILLAWITH
jgi:hypothetical protein